MLEAKSEINICLIYLCFYTHAFCFQRMCLEIKLSLLWEFRSQIYVKTSLGFKA